MGNLTHFDEEALFLKDIPGFIIMLLMSVFGTFGNIHAFLVYFFRFKKSNYRIIVLTLVLVDLFACVIAIPHDLLDMRFNFNIHPSGISCTLFIFMDYANALSSVSLLAFIALERRHAICNPLGHHVNLKRVKIISVSIIIVCGIISTPCFAFYGRPQHSDHHGSTTCQDTREHIFVWFQAFMIFIIVITVTLFSICAFCYISLARTLHKQGQIIKYNDSLRKSQLMKTQTKEEDGVDRSVEKDSGISSFARVKPDVSSQVETDNGSSRVHDDGGEGTDSSSMYQSDKSKEVASSQNSKKAVCSRRKYARSLRLVIVFLTATCISYISWITTVFIISGTSLGLPLTATLGRAYTIILRLHYVNNVVNPIVYCVMDPVFRKECKCLYQNCFKRISEKF